MLQRIATLTWHHPRKVLAAAGLLAVLSIAFGYDVEEHLKAAGFTDPSSESERASRVLADAIGHSAEPGLVVLVRAEDGGPLDIDDPAVAAEINRIVEQTRGAEFVGNVVNPLEEPEAGLVAPDGRSVAIPAQLSSTDIEDAGGVADESVRERTGSDLLDVGYGGFAPSFNEVNDQTRKDLFNAEKIAFPVLAILLLLVFRGVVAAGVPLLIGVLSILGTFLALRIMAAFFDTSLFALNITTGLSLGLAVDYALLIVSRYREEAETHGFTEEAHRRTVLTAGRAALFSGFTVAAAMAALVLMPQRFLYSIGFAGAVVGLISAAMALLVVPALLAVLGPRINKWSLRKGPSVSDASTRWLKIARGVMKRPVLVALGTSAALLAIAAPVAATTLTGPSAQAVPPGQQSYAVNQYMSDHYGRALTEGISVTIKGDASDADLATLGSEAKSVEGVASLTPFVRINEKVAYATGALAGPALSSDSQDSVRDIRALDPPSGSEMLVNGNTARFIDEKSSLIKSAPLVIALIVLLTVVLLFLLTGSVVLPLKTLVMNALTLSATLGILVIVFEKKFLVGALSYPGPYAVEVTSLVFLFAVTFALATDYAVLVMARIKELRDGGMSNEDAVATGVARTGRIISAAALLVAVVFLAFAVSPVFFMKQIAIGMALGVIIDATVVRALLVPSLMRLLGEANWWAPKPLRRLHGRFGIRES